VLIPARFSDTGKQQARFFDSKTEAETEIRRILNRGNSSKPKVTEADEAAWIAFRLHLLLHFPCCITVTLKVQLLHQIRIG